ncbi:hypothetical protein DPMN_025345 [Dreissena polymorpha]|uniref:Uncharacterized protein n=1 Tax=Dreissena polymorpha TaxID=45954 RepID=A0A9D4RBR8_DREPO|nr:hypothetical protein DPMN_025345 [Dreissena polymorpha]
MTDQNSIYLRTLTSVIGLHHATKAATGIDINVTLPDKTLRLVILDLTTIPGPVTFILTGGWSVEGKGFGLAYSPTSHYTTVPNHYTTVPKTITSTKAG